MDQQSRAVRIEFDYSDGSVQRLIGEAAERWLKEVNGVVMAASFRYGRQGQSPLSDFQWQTIRGGKKTLPCAFDNYGGTD